LAVLLVPSVTAGAAYADDYEYPSNRSASVILSAKLIAGPHHLVRERVVTYGYMHRWTVESDFGTFEVAGDGALRKLINEINAIAALRKIKKSDAFLTSIKQSAKAPFELGKKLITDPIDTISGVPKGVFSIFGNVAKGVTMKHDPSEDAKIKQILFVSSWKRDFAFEHGVDVYSSNKLLQKELNSVGWAAAVAGLSVSVAAAASSATVVIVGKNLRFANQLNNVLKEEPPSRLRLINEEKLKKMGVSKNLIKTFLDHPHFTPRHDTVIVESLAGLSGARGRDTFIRSILSAEDEESANFFQGMAEILRGYHDTTAPITDVTVLAGWTIAKSVNGTALIPFPMDHGVWTSRAEQFVKYITKNYRPPGFTGKFEIWLTGTVSPKAKAGLQSGGLKVVEDVDQRIILMN
jgi:hypothetical protein